MDDQKTIRLENGTVGIINCPEVEIGMVITVQHHDENGRTVFSTGVAAEVLE